MRINKLFNALGKYKTPESAYVFPSMFRGKHYDANFIEKILRKGGSENRLRRFSRKTKTAIISFFLCLILAAPLYAVDPMDFLDSGDSTYAEEIKMLKGELVAVEVNNLTRVSVTDPAIADIVDADDKTLLVIGKSAGQTALFIWDERGKRISMLYVFEQDLDIIKTRIEKLLNTAKIYKVKLDVNYKEGRVVVSGEVEEYKKNMFDEIMGPFSDHVIDLVGEEKSEDLIQIDMQITEMNTTETKNLGIEWATGTQTGSGNTLTTTSSGAFNPIYGEIFPTLKPGREDFLKIGDFQRTTNSALIAKINALEEQGKARILSKPKLVVISGEEASFLVGGEIPIRTTTFSSSGSSQENVEFKEFGVSMTITPTIKKEKIDIVMNLEISEVDASTASTVSSDVAFSTRSASTHLFLEDGQTIILAGLIKHSTSETIKKVPFLGDIPIVGLLFRNKSNPVPDMDQELVIALTPHILTRQNPPSFQKASADRGAGWSQGERVRRPSYKKAVPYYLGIPKEMTEYVRDIQQSISRTIVYPHEAKRQGLEGTVKIGLLILNDGTLAFALVKESSGHDIFDTGAVSTTKKLAPFSAFPSETDLQELNVTIPIVYSLK